MNDKICSVFGHREIEPIDWLDNLELNVAEVAIDLIENKGVGTFWFGGFGAFDELCHSVVTKLKKEKYPFLQRVYICEDARFEDNPRKRPDWLTTEDYENFLFLPMRYTGFNKRIYFRNCEMIKHCDFCIFYVHHTEHSGAFKALQYAQKTKKEFFCV